MQKTNFQAQPTLLSDTLELRPLRPEDLEGLFAAASDPRIWADHPASNRYKRDVFEKYFDFLLGTKSALVVIDRQSGRIIGCSRYYEAPDRPDSMSIGFTFLNNAYWGGETNFEIKRLMLDHAFQTFPEVWFHIAPTNIRSQKATGKLGAEHVYNAVLNVSGTPSEGMCFRLSRDAWSRALQDRNTRRAAG